MTSINGTKAAAAAGPGTKFPTLLKIACVAFAACAGLATATVTPAAAQKLVATVNDAPITNYDIAQRVKLLRALREQSTPAAALESLVEDRVKEAEAKKYSIKPTKEQILNYVVRDGQKRKIPQQRLAYALQRGGIDEAHWMEHFGVQLSWDTLIGAIYKAVNVSNREVDAELGRRGKSTNRSEYKLQQIVLIVPASAGPAGFQARLREANSLRARFKNCREGAQLARALRDVAVQAPVTRRANELNEQLIKVLDRTPVGQLTQPARGTTGVEMIAVCAKTDVTGRAAAGQTIREELLSKKLEVHSKRRYQELRGRAIVVRR
ncbi:MAG: SurA N-terminal domain-containing protein [Beijerinckiaceae bacterium]